MSDLSPPWAAKRTFADAINNRCGKATSVNATIRRTSPALAVRSRLTRASRGQRASGRTRTLDDASVIYGSSRVSTDRSFHLLRPASSWARGALLDLNDALAGDHRSQGRRLGSRSANLAKANVWVSGARSLSKAGGGSPVR